MATESFNNVEDRAEQSYEMAQRLTQAFRNMGSRPVEAILRDKGTIEEIQNAVSEGN